MDKLIKYAEDQAKDLHSLIINIDGRRVYSFGDTDERRDIYSATKSILSIAVGELYESGRLDIDSPLHEYLTDAQRRLIPENKRADFEFLPVTRFLTMSVGGYPFRPEGESGWLSQALGADADYKNAQFSYSNFPALLVGAVCENITGGLVSYIKDMLYRTADIKNADVKLTPEGYFYGASGMKLSCAELERTGLYLLRHADEKSGYYARAFSPQIKTDSGSYGYYFWLENGCICISGKWGQKCIISPEDNRVICYLSTGQKADEKLYQLAVEVSLAP